MEQKYNGFIVLSIILSFLICTMTGKIDLFIVMWSIYGFGAWLFSDVGAWLQSKFSEPTKVLSVSNKYIAEGNRPQGTMPAERAKSGPWVNIVSGETETPDIANDKRWFDTLVKNAVHILIIGETNSGKSTAAKAILYARANKGEQVIILDPHARPSTWLGLDAIGRGRDYAAIESMISILRLEMDRRYKEYAKDDNYNPTRLNIFVDEVPSIATYCESWQEFFTVISCEARKVNMSLICLSQSRLVDMLGIKGRSDTRENFSEIFLGDKAIKVIPESSKQTRPAVVDYNGRVSMVDTSMLPTLGNTEINQNVLWVPPINLVPENGAQSVTGVSLMGPLTEGEMIQVNDWDSEEVSRREMARRLYKQRGGTGDYKGDGPLFQILKQFLDN